MKTQIKVLILFNVFYAFPEFHIHEPGSAIELILLSIWLTHNPILYLNTALPII